MPARTVKIGKRGTVVLPADLRRAMGLEEDTLALIEAREDGLLIRPAVALPVEVYSPERKAEFLLSNATDEDDYQAARAEVEAMGLDPDAIPHGRPD
jgi:AbrB family looped-hinge helix DNA binding protein